MKKFFPLLCICLILNVSLMHSQVGIGTTNPAATSILDISSTTQGLLAPRMTTAQRMAIISPANGLFVYDTDLKSFYFYDSTKLPAPGAWNKIKAASDQRNNYKLVKSAADLAPELAAGGGSSYLLQTNTYYEINGTITLTAPINLNDAYVAGLDANEDRLSRASGNVFAGNTGGSIRNITIAGGGTAFNITGGASLLIQNTVVIGMASVGTISGVGLYFGNIIQFVGNTNGITYNNIGNLLLNNQAWLSNNSGTYERLTGTFGLVEKASGFSTANGYAIAFDVSTNPIVGNGVMLGTVFSGTSASYINRYTTGSFPGFNFNNNWTVDCPGIPLESDDLASANLFFVSAAVVNIGNTTPFKLPVSTTSIRSFRTGARVAPDQNNSIVYEGRRNRAMNLFGSVSFTATAGSRYSFSIRKNGLPVTGTESSFDVLQTNQRQTVSIIGTVDVIPNDNIEIYVQKTTAGADQFLVTAYNVIIN